MNERVCLFCNFINQNKGTVMHKKISKKHPFGHFVKICLNLPFTSDGTSSHFIEFKFNRASKLRVQKRTVTDNSCFTDFRE